MSATIAHYLPRWMMPTVRTVFSQASSRAQKVRALQDIGFCAIGAGLMTAGISALIGLDATSAFASNAFPIVATIGVGLWALKAT